MKLRVITIGKFRSKAHQEIASEYIDKLGHYLPFEYISVKDEKDVLKRIGPDDYFIVCDERGKKLVSTAFAELVEERQIRSTKYLTFAIGPAEGFSAETRARASLVLSFSDFTIQHDLATLVLLEQLYRACTIIRGEPYHK